jgi:hypothetical protein
MRTGRQMSIFSRKNKAKNQVDKIIEDANKKTEKEFKPVRDVISAITNAVVECREGIKPLIDEPDESKRQFTEVYIFHELIFFFMHLAMRQAASLMSENEISRFQEYIGPMVADLTVDSYFQHVPEEWKSKMKSEFFHNLNNSEKEYANSSRFDSLPPLEGRSTEIVERLLHLAAERIAVLLGRGSNPATVARITQVILKTFLPFDLKIPMECFKQDSMGLPPYRAVYGTGG